MQNATFRYAVPAGHQGFGAGGLRHRFRHVGAGLFAHRGACARHRPGLHLRPGHDAGHPGGLLAQPPRDDHRLSRDRQVDPCRAGRGAPELALRPHQPRQPRVARRPRRQGRHRAAGRQAGHGVPRRHAALGAAEQRRALLRRIRRRPARRDVRDPARAGTLRPPDAARPEARDQAAPGLPPLRHRQHGRASATRRASITARSRSTRARWIAGRSSRP